MILQKTVEEIIDRAKIEDVVSDFVKLRRSGTGLVGLCPFHNEKTGSFSVSVTKNIATCFGCGKGGDPIAFLRQKEGFSFPQALRYLAKKYNIVIEEKEVTPEDLQRQQRKAAMYIANEFAAKHFRDNLYQDNKKKKVGQDYFTKRGFTKETIEKWKLGYNPDVGLLTTEMVKNGYDTKMLQALSLSNERNTDFFRFRATFALQEDRNGKIVGFAGRTLLSPEKATKTPKYLNSKESELYHKSNFLYGLIHAKRAIREQDECILTEGYTDVISLHQSGIENVVASSGTALTSQQVNKIKRLTNNVVILYDGDKAGINAALKGIDLFLAADMDVRICLLPEGDDPDVYLNRVGKDAFLAYLKTESKDFILFKIAVCEEKIAQEPAQKSKLVQDILASITKMPDKIKRAIYIKQLAGLMDLSEELFTEVVADIVEVETTRNLKAFAAEKVNQPAPELDFLYVVNETEEASICEIEVDEQFVEREVIDLLLLAGNEPFAPDCGFTIADYVLSYSMECIKQIDNPVYVELLKEINNLNKVSQTIPFESFKTYTNLAFQRIYEVAGQTIILTNPTQFAIDVVSLLFLRSINRMIRNQDNKLGAALKKDNYEGVNKRHYYLDHFKAMRDTTTLNLLSPFSEQLVQDCIAQYQERIKTIAA